MTRVTRMMSRWADIEYPWEVCFHGADMAMTHVPTVLCFYEAWYEGNTMYAARIKPLGLSAYGSAVELAIDRLKDMFKEHLEVYAERDDETYGKYGVEWYLNSDNANEVDWVCSCNGS